MTRGVRNNNPGNIRRSASKWQGMADVQQDKQFVQFKAMEWGIRAMWVLLQGYHARHGCNTLRKAIERWAPPSDGNRTADYVAFVAKNTGINADRELLSPLADSLRWAAAMQQMCKMESCYAPTIKELLAAYDLAFNQD